MPPAQPRPTTAEVSVAAPAPAVTPSGGAAVARKVRGVWDTLPPVISGGWQGSPIEVRDAPPLPAGWSGLAIEYQRGPHADGPWYFEKDGSRLLSEDRRRVVRTYLLWHAPTQEGIVINPTARDAAHAIELARAQAGIRWRVVIDTISDAATSPKLAGKDWVAWRNQVAFKGAGVGLRDYEKPWRDKFETVAAASVAKELGATTITRGQLAPTTLAADKLLVYRSYMDNPHDRALIVEWGPFEVMSDWHD